MKDAPVASGRVKAPPEYVAWFSGLGKRSRSSAQQIVWREMKRLGIPSRGGRGKAKPS